MRSGKDGLDLVGGADECVTGHQFLEYAGTLPQGTVEEKLAIQVDHVENHISDRDFAHKLRAHFFAAETLLQGAEGKRPARDFCFAGLPGNGNGNGKGNDFAIENGFIGPSGQRARQFWEGSRNFIAGAGKDADFTSSDVGLRADAIVFVLDRGILEIAQGLLGRRDRAGEHQVEGMEDAQLGRVEVADKRQAEGCADVAKQHVGPLYRRERLAEGASNGFFDEALFQANAQVSGDDFHDVLGFEGSCSIKNSAHQPGFCRRKSGRCDFEK